MRRCRLTNACSGPAGKQRVTIDKVEAFTAKLSDIGASQGVMVSAAGFDAGDSYARGRTARQGSNEFPDGTPDEGAWAERQAWSSAGEPSMRTCDSAPGRKIERGSIGARAGMSEALNDQFGEGVSKREVDASMEIRIAPPKPFGLAVRRR